MSPNGAFGSDLADFVAAFVGSDFLALRVVVAASAVPATPAMQANATLAVSSRRSNKVPRRAHAGASGVKPIDGAKLILQPLKPCPGTLEAKHCNRVKSPRQLHTKNCELWPAGNGLETSQSRIFGRKTPVNLLFGLMAALAANRRRHSAPFGRPPTATRIARTPT